MRLQEEAHHKDLTKNSFTSQTLELQIQKLRQEEAIEHGSNAASVKPVSKRTLARLALQVTPKLVRNAQTQNVRRLRGEGEPRARGSSKSCRPRRKAAHYGTYGEWRSLWQERKPFLPPSWQSVFLHESHL
eukprot:gene2069-2257_t